MARHILKIGVTRWSCLHGCIGCALSLSWRYVGLIRSLYRDNIWNDDIGSHKDDGVMQCCSGYNIRWWWLRYGVMWRLFDCKGLDRSRHVDERRITNYCTGVEDLLRNADEGYDWRIGVTDAAKELDSTIEHERQNDKSNWERQLHAKFQEEVDHSLRRRWDQQDWHEVEVAW